MYALSHLSQSIFYIIVACIGLLTLVIWVWQAMVLQGKAMKNPDGSADDWHRQETHYGLAFADVFLACPASMTGIVLLFLAPRWGYYLLALISFWFVWANVMTTATSLRFHNPKITLNWFITFPFGALVGLAYIVWTLLHFDAVYFP